MLVQCAKAASRVKGSYFAAQYQRIAARRGKNRATMAVAHSMLIAIYHVLKEGVPFRDLGADYYDGFRREHKIRNYPVEHATITNRFPIGTSNEWRGEAHISLESGIMAALLAEQ